MSATESFRAFADCLREPAILVSTSGDVLALNSAAGQLFGVGAFASSLAFRLADFLHGGGAALDDFIRACSRTRQPIFASLALRTPSGEAASYRAEGLLYQAGDARSPATVFLRLTPREAASAPLLALDERLRAFARGHSGSPRHVAVNEIVTEAASLLRPLLDEGIELVTHLSPQSPIVYLDPSQVERAIVNLGVHARGLLANGGTLTIETRAAKLGFAPIAVRHSGPVIPAPVLATIFEPFSTVQSPAFASGISLASTRAALLELGGQIEVESHADTGTVFTLLLPIAHSEREVGRRTPASVTLLVVDDDDMTRDVIAESLTSAGFTVLSASDGEAAVEIARAHTGDIDLLITDVVMPRLTGPRVARILRERLPDMRVLYVSGYTDGIDLPLEARDARSGFLAKPFGRGTLVGRVQALLET